MLKLSAHIQWSNNHFTFKLFFFYFGGRDIGLCLPILSLTTLIIAIITIIAKYIIE